MWGWGFSGLSCAQSAPSSGTVAALTLGSKSSKWNKQRKQAGGPKATVMNFAGRLATGRHVCSFRGICEVEWDLLTIFSAAQQAGWLAAGWRGPQRISCRGLVSSCMKSTLSLPRLASCGLMRLFQALYQLEENWNQPESSAQALIWALRWCSESLCIPWVSCKERKGLALNLKAKLLGYWQTPKQNMHWLPVALTFNIILDSSLMFQGDSVQGWRIIPPHVSIFFIC
jgi:hypothetical protein